MLILFLKHVYSFYFEAVNKVIDHLKPYRVTIITNFAIMRDQEIFYHEINGPTPSVIVDLEDMKVKNDS